MLLFKGTALTIGYLLSQDDYTLTRRNSFTMIQHGFDLANDALVMICLNIDVV